MAAGLYLPAEAAAQLANAGVGLYGAPGTWYGPGAAQGWSAGSAGGAGGGASTGLFASGATGLAGAMSNVIGPIGLFLGGMNALTSLGTALTGKNNISKTFIKNLQKTIEGSDDPFEAILSKNVDKLWEVNSEGARWSNTVWTGNKTSYKGLGLGTLINSLPEQNLQFLKFHPKYDQIVRTLVNSIGSRPTRNSTFKGVLEAGDPRKALKRLYPNIDMDAVNKVYEAQKAYEWRKSYGDTTNYDGARDINTDWDAIDSEGRQWIQDMKREVYESIGLEMPKNTIERKVSNPTTNKTSKLVFRAPGNRDY